MTNAIRISPIDIQQKRFHVGFRGYDRIEVELFLDLVRDEMETLAREITELREFRQSYDQRLNELAKREEAVKNTMLLTQKLVEELKENAKKESALVVRDAEVRCQQIVGSAQAEKLKLAGEIQELKRRKHHFIQDIKKVVEMHLEMVNFEEAGDESKEPARA